MTASLVDNWCGSQFCLSVAHTGLHVGLGKWDFFSANGFLPMLHLSSLSDILMTFPGYLEMQTLTHAALIHCTVSDEQSIV